MTPKLFYKWHILILLVCSIVLFSCSSKNKFKIHGTFTELDPTPVKLYHLTEDKSVLADSVNVISEPEFFLSAQAEHASIYSLKIFNDKVIYLVVFPGDDISIEIDNRSENISYYVEGSFDSKLIKEIIDRQNIVLRKITELSRLWEQSVTDTVKRKNIDSIYVAIMKEHQQYTRDIIYKNPGSLANIFALYQNFGIKPQPLFDNYDDIDIFNFVDSNLTVRYPNTEAVIALNRDVTEIKEQIERNNYIRKRVEIGTLLPELEAPTIASDTVVLPSGQALPNLMLFWASFNDMSVQTLLELDAFAKTREGKKMNIVTISIDTSGEKLKEFLDSNNISLPVICDYKYWDSELAGKYAVKKIPYTILTNKQGIITDIDVYGNNLMLSIDKSIHER